MRNANLVEEGSAEWPAGHGAGRFDGWRTVAGLAFAAGLALFAASELQQQAPQSYATGPGEQRTIAAGEGSRITLNAGTRLRAALARGQRKVWLDDGEAAFDIAAGGARALVIDAGIGRVTAQASRLSVRREPGKVSVLVAEGQARVGQAGKEVILNANGSATLNKDGIVQGVSYSSR